MSSRALRRTATLALVGAVAFATSTAAPARAALLPSGGTAASTTVSSAIDPPAGGTAFQGESLPEVTPVADVASSGGAYGQLVRSSVVSGLPAGNYLLTARVKADGPARVDLLSADQMVGTYGVGPVWTVVNAVLTVDPADSRVGVGSWVRSGQAPAVSVDWLHLAAVGYGFTVRGTNVIRPDRATYRPVGLNKADYADSWVYNNRLQFPSSEAVSLHAWGVSTVRLQLNQEFWLADCAVWSGSTATTYKTAVLNEVRELTARGVFVLVTLLNTERGVNTGCNVTKGGLREMADERSVVFWREVATAFKSNFRVMFDLFNEPHDITAEQWRNGGLVRYGPWKGKSFVAVGMQTLYDTVRSTGATNVVTVSGLNWASDPRVLLSTPLDGYGIIAASHSYCHDCTETDPHPHELLETLNDAEIRGRHPLTITETGWRTQSTAGATYNRAMIDWADANGVGWLVYGWMAHLNASTPDVYSLLATSTPTFKVGSVSTRAPAPSGYPVWNELAPYRVARGFSASPMEE
jgi:endoglucanase